MHVKRFVTKKQQMKSHITRSHTRKKEAEKRSRDDDVENENDNKKLKENKGKDEEDSDEEFLSMYNDDGNLKEDVKADETNVGNIGEDRDNDKKTQTLEEELAVMRARIEAMQEELKVKDKLLNLANTKAATLEHDNLENISKVEKFRKIASKQ